LLRLVLGYAVTSGTLSRNVAAAAAPPKVEDREVEILSPDAIKAVLDTLQGHALHPIVSLALATGMRRGELCGLQWGDVDLDKATLRVKRSVEETRAGLRLKSPKTKRGRRSLTLPPETVTMLRNHKVQQMQLRLVLGQGAVKPETFVFNTVEDGMLSPDNLSRDWRQVCQEAAAGQLSCLEAYPCQPADSEGCGHPDGQPQARALQGVNYIERLWSSDSCHGRESGRCARGAVEIKSEQDFPVDLAIWVAFGLQFTICCQAGREQLIEMPKWRRGREAEGGGLLNRYTVKSRIEGSNPSVSARRH